MNLVSLIKKGSLYIMFRVDIIGSKKTTATLDQPVARYYLAQDDKNEFYLATNLSAALMFDTKNMALYTLNQYRKEFKEFMEENTIATIFNYEILQVPESKNVSPLVVNSGKI